MMRLPDFLLQLQKIVLQHLRHLTGKTQIELRICIVKVNMKQLPNFIDSIAHRVFMNMQLVCGVV